MVKIDRVVKVEPPFCEAVERLMPQLSATLTVPGVRELERVVASSSTALFCARSEDAIIGMLSLAWYDVPSGRNAWIEDVVVDAAFRGRGIARLLLDAGVEYAEQIGAAKVSLTSHASRTAAHALYRAKGFENYDTTLFRLKLK